MNGPLAGLRIVDLTRILAGPLAAMHLADLGADVVKIERPGAGDDTRAWGPPFVGTDSAYFLAINRNKRSIAIDLKTPDGRRIVERLLKNADVLLDNFRPGVMEGFGWTDEALAKINPRLVRGTLSGHGRSGPRRDDPVFDLLMQAEGGVMDVTGPEDGPPTKAGLPVSDLSAAFFLVEGVLAALLERARTGRGQTVEIALLDSTLAALTFQAQMYLAAGQVPRRMGNRHPTLAPYEVFRSRDGWIAVAVANEGQWGRLCAALGEPALAQDPRFAVNADRVRNRAALEAVLEPKFAGRATGEWLVHLKTHDVPAGPVRTIPEILEAPTTQQRGLLATVMHPTRGSFRMVACPIRMGDHPAGEYTAPPRVGQHTDEVLRAAGFSNEEVADMKKRGIVVG